ncbi:Shwachman-Bodian-diamond syndrome protein [Gonapodya prolifera JEL478]|uniref:Ribosome maturation protein SDO1 n=1 Tax=Gonapodya prolifera (strain JEL478) TaxID=1344416 RepID=A0A139AL94_GONPJ|nr:Shwachman-Bodian-diamond syndrome protein [Gonapodya prolifera JEL478]|eukprot:KXS17556.1 Shwachman-Bodian-diamond syndrome protein [Gonapodya prolifera JEL478]
MAKIFTPSNQIRLTNVAVVKLKKGGKRFELACYKNKVLEWRNGVETDLDNVVQIHKVFLNVSKGVAANAEDMKKAFGTDDEPKIILEILRKGELQVGDRERQNLQETLSRDIVTQVADMCVNPETKRPYTVSMIEQAMLNVGFSVNTGKGAKQQALDLIRVLQSSSTLPIARARMRLRITTPSRDGKRIKDRLHEMIAEIEGEEFGDEYEVFGLIDPGQYRPITELISSETKGKGDVELLDLKEEVDETRLI